MTEVATGRDLSLKWEVLVTPGIPAVTSGSIGHSKPRSYSAQGQMAGGWGLCGSSRTTWKQATAYPPVTDTLNPHKGFFWSDSCIYNDSGREMIAAIQHCDGDRFANGQDSCNLRGSPDPTEPGMQFIETIDSYGRLLSLRREFGRRNVPKIGERTFQRS